MHVLVVTIVHDPRDARIRARQIESLLRAGHLVTYAAPFDAEEAPDADGGAIRHRRLPRARGRHRLRAQIAAWRTIRELDGEVDLVIGHDPELLVALATVRHSVAVWDVHEDLAASIGDKAWVPRPLRPALSWFARHGLRILARRVRLILAEEGYRSEWPDAPVVANTPWFPARVPPPDDGRIVYVGRISRGRGAAALLALAHDPRLRGRLHLYGPVDDDLADDVRDADAAGVLHWHGFVANDEALTRIEGASVGVSALRDLANYRHSMPTKILEYMARGVPVVTTPLPRARRIVEGSRCGVVVSHDDIDELADAVAAVLGDAGLRAELARRGRDAVADRCWDLDGPAFVDHLVALVDARRSG